MLHARDHRVTVFTQDPVAFQFFSAQGFQVSRSGEKKASPTFVPIEEFAARDCLLAGHPQASPAMIRRASKPLLRALASLQQIFEISPPDLVMFHQGRSGLHQLIHFLARQHGCPTLHAGEGLLPATIQWDQDGIDGDSSLARRASSQYENKLSDDIFLAAALSSWLASSTPPPLAYRPLTIPRLGSRAGLLLAALSRLDLPVARRALLGWREAIPERHLPPSACLDIPGQPYLAVLLQRADDPRILLDSPPGSCPDQLALATVHAAQQLGSKMPVVGIMPPDGLPRRSMRLLEKCGVLLHDAATAPHILATALAVTTVNAGLGIGAVLAGTPLLNTGRSPWAIPGISHPTSIDNLAQDLPAALGHDPSALRESFLTRILLHDHVWCSMTHPDQNGISGIVAGIEQRLTGGPSTPAAYRPGPVWPLQAETLKGIW